ncbi:unnamed protein product [Arabidopsis arenosa]|uniref:Protein kinase domain-containing protein n=1 Tax=Arabidopsis arenosa TaxID=38785 RepID=A0A8S2AA86_ARAAE|nr:unnamed protein product [Arabidopsis arenosa]
MSKFHLGTLCFLISLLGLANFSVSQNGVDDSTMEALKSSLNLTSDVDWSNPNPCKWESVECDGSNRVTKIQLKQKGIRGTLPTDLQKLSELVVLELFLNRISGPIPDLSGLSRLQTLNLHDNLFESVPKNLFSGMSSLQEVYLENNPFNPWQIPDTIKEATSLQNLTLSNCSIFGKIPDFFGSQSLPSLTNLKLSQNRLQGELPVSFAGTSIQSLFLNGQVGEQLNGSISILRNMTSLVEVSLQGNKFSGPIPDLSGLLSLRVFNVRENQLTGVVPQSLIRLNSLTTVNLTNNLLQGPTPLFGKSVGVDIFNNTNSFCTSIAGEACDPRVDTLVSVAESFGYPVKLASSWKGNNPCVNWVGITCSGGNITVVNLRKQDLSGTISASLANLTSLETINLSDNELSGPIPTELTTLSKLRTLDVSNNDLYGVVPKFPDTVHLVIEGNVNIGKTGPISPSGSPGASPGSKPSGGSGGSETSKKSSNVKIIVPVVGGVVGALCLVGLGVCLYAKKRKRPARVQSPSSNMVIHPHHSGDNDDIKLTVAASSLNSGGGSDSYSHSGSAASDIHVVEAGNLVISIQVLRNVTNNFSEENILGRAPDGKYSIETRVAGTFGYLAPEYAVTGRVTTKVDIFSLGVILMELITGRKALDETQPEDSVHLVTWFRRIAASKDENAFKNAIDPNISLDDDTLASIEKVWELAGHCCAREPYQRPDMAHIVNVLSSLTVQWKPTETDPDDVYGIDYDMPLPQVLKKWQAFEGLSQTADDSGSSSSAYGSKDNTQTSIPTRPSGFADSFTSVDGR